MLQKIVDLIQAIKLAVTKSHVMLRVTKIAIKSGNFGSRAECFFLSLNLQNAYI